MRLSTDKVTELLLSRDITPTQQRLEIGAILFSGPQHFSAEQVMQLVNQEGAQVSKATVYNTLGLFAEKGLVREVIIDPTKVFFDSNTQPHHHLYDVSTGELSDISADEVALSRLPKLPKNVTVESVEVVVRVRRRT
ncbi:MAG: transcriptional repressor [Gammaproteobacteria bacterium]|nr:transcriptional repressor [Gammaproteobacteria bacterium]MDJ0872204.1 transcriptional repressor [Gammaproteobacteria bacterium]MDJ0891158.1 transcriptional repressor [Gammaproteobacteria bacterium]